MQYALCHGHMRVPMVERGEAITLHQNHSASICPYSQQW